MSRLLLKVSSIFDLCLGPPVSSDISLRQNLSEVVDNRWRNFEQRAVRLPRKAFDKRSWKKNGPESETAVFGTHFALPFIPNSSGERQILPLTNRV